MSNVALALIIILVYLCVYSIIDRICKAAENCALYKSFDRYLATTDKKTKTQTALNNLSETIERMKKSGEKDAL